MEADDLSTDEEDPVDPDDIREYRKFLVKADHQASIDFDKAIMTLSGGAFGISIAFLKDVAPNPALGTRVLLIASWVAFAVSLAAILLSYMASMGALRKTIERVDDGTIYDKGVTSSL